MRYILSRENLRALALFSEPPVLYGFDFDGTLAPIVRDRDAAGMRSSTLRRFRALCDRFPTVVISGRSRADVVSRLMGASVRHVVGNHGLEMDAEPLPPPPSWGEVREALEPVVAAFPEIEIEDKRLSLSIHYRYVRSPRDAQKAILSALGDLPSGHHLIPGKRVINILPEGGANKGTALQTLCAREGVEKVVFVGDDVTDEDIFTLQGVSVLGIRVGEEPTSAARYFLREQGEIDSLLDRVLAFR